MMFERLALENGIVYLLSGGAPDALPVAIDLAQ